MFTLLVCSALVAVSSAQYSIVTGSGFFPGYSSPLLHPSFYGSFSPYISHTPLPLASPVFPVSSQYHSQDELGQFAFGHKSDLHAREEVKTADGTVIGSYSYLDATGKLNKVEYKADHGGFQVLGANNLPIAPVETLEPVKDTPEVVAARADFARKFEEAKIAAEKEPENHSRRRRDLFATPYLSTLIKTNEFKTVDDAKTPANTKLAEIKESEKELLTPLALPIHHTFPLHTFPTTYSLSGIDSFSYVPHLYSLDDKTILKDLKPVDDKVVIKDLKPTEDKVIVKDLKPIEIKPLDDIKIVHKFDPFLTTSPLFYNYPLPLLKK